MKKRVENPAPPFQLSYVRPDGTVVPQEIWVCGECRHLSPGRHDEADAAACCAVKKCGCGEVITPDYYTLCTRCRSEKEAKAEAERIAKMPVVAYKDEPIFHGGRFYDSMEELLDWLADEEAEDRPETVEICSRDLVGSKLSGADVVDYVSEQLLESFEDPDSVDLDDTEGLKSFVDGWLQKQSAEIWEPSGKRVKVVIDDNA